MRDVEADNLGAILLRNPRIDIAAFPPFMEHLEKNYTLDREFVGAERGYSIELWRRKSNPPTR